MLNWKGALGNGYLNRAGRYELVYELRLVARQ